MATPLLMPASVALAPVENSPLTSFAIPLALLYTGIDMLADEETRRDGALFVLLPFIFYAVYVAC